MASLAAMALSKFVPAWSAFWWDVAWTASSLVAVVGTLEARRFAAPANRFRWTLWAAAAGCWVAGQMAWNVFGVIGFPSSPNLADLGWFAFAGIVIVSLFRTGPRSPSVRLVAVLETLPVMASAVALTIAELWHDASVSSLALAPKLSALAYPAFYVAAAVLLLQAMISGSLRGARSAAPWLVLGGMAAQSVAFCLWSRLLLAGTYVPGHTFLDPLWVAGLLAIGAGGMLAARRPEQVVRTNSSAPNGGVLPAAMFVLLLTALIHAQLSHGPSGVAVTLRLGLLLSGVALIVRGALLEQRLRVMLDRERAAMTILGEREIEMARLNAQLAEDSRRDQLTGMRNRRALADDLPGLDARRAEEGRGFAMALCDVDHFKAYNDRLGHLAGDHALRVIAATVRDVLRECDLAYRFGGEELLLIFQDLDSAAAAAEAERVREAIRRSALAHPEGIDGELTVSIGVAAGEESSSELLDRADAALYDAKHAGRNCVRVSAEGDLSFAAGRRHRVADEPVPRHLSSMMAVSKAAAAGHGPTPVLEALAETIHSELSFRVVAVNLLDPDRRELTCTVVLGDDDARRTLLGTVNPWPEWDELMESGHQRCGAIWLPAGSYRWKDESQMWTPPSVLVPVPGEDGWDPQDMLLLPVRGQDGAVLAVVSVDEPVTGRRPDDAEIALLMAVADHAGLALEQSRRDVEHSAAVQEQSTELRLAAVMLLAETLDLRDAHTARHSRTVGEFARRTAEALRLPADRVDQIHAAGVLHDLGKLGIADAILFKPAPLDELEWREIRRHPEIGARILQHAGLIEIATWVRAHHERIDGYGYPDRLRGEEIAPEARILAVADAYEAMIADRPYRAGMAPAAARDELLRCAGTQFDPSVVQAFIGTLGESSAPGSPSLVNAA